MSDLPATRVTQSEVFQNTGVDYAGPICIKRNIGGRGNQTVKAYVAVFICFSTHAIHLEAVSDMTADAFISTLRRFISRRGRPFQMFSDCGSNFLKASREITEYRDFLQKDPQATVIHEFLASKMITWHFNPPSSPHFGGLWESAVKLMKSHLIRCIGNSILNFEELSTLLTQVEACVNSRPLTPVSSSPEDLSPLTPGHFLIG
ncbi:unnamed protein product, partial [Allacma fusca]